jgi:hypothetical protein
VAAIALTTALCITGIAIWHDRTEKAEQAKRDQTVEAQLLRNVHNIGAKLVLALPTGPPTDDQGVAWRLATKEPGGEV